MLDKLKEYKELIPILTIVLYIIGFIYNVSYYASYGIEVIPYISLTEILIYSIIGVAVLCIVVIPIESLVQKILLSIYKEKNTVSYLISLLFHAIIFYIFYNISSDNGSILMIVICAIINLMWVYNTIFFIPKYKFNLKWAPIFCLFVGVISGILSISILGTASAHNVINNEQKYKIEIVANEDTYSTIDNKDLYFLGETNLVYFLYDNKLKASIILDKRKVNKVVIYK